MYSNQKLPAGEFWRAALCVYLLLVQSVLWSPAAVGAEQKATQAQLKALKKNLGKLELRLKEERKQHSSAEKSLAETEEEIGRLSRQVYELDQALGGLKLNLSGFEEEKARLEEELAISKEKLVRLLQRQYRQGRQPRLHIWLNQRDPEKFTRMMKYYDSLGAAQLREVEVHRSLLENLAGTHVSIDTTKAQMLENRQQLQVQLTALEALRKERSDKVAQLQKQVGSTQGQIKKYKADRKRLEKVLADIEKSVSLASLTQNNKAFKTLKGKIKWPIKGKVLRRYGRVYNNLSFDGLLVAGQAGDNIAAVHHGRVVFSDWLRGYGLLTIIDHGDGYMSLYGHNDTLLKEPGDWVSQGETIATVGNSGGYEQPGLYFAIRYKGRSTNPESWLARL